MLSIEELFHDIKRLSPVPLKAASSYYNKSKALTEYVNSIMTNDDTIYQLVGNNSLEMMYDNHKNHAAFMSVIFSLNNYNLLVKTVPWVYRAYSQHGFTYDYFPIELSTWKRAVTKMIATEEAGPILAVYDWMLENHSHMIAVSQSETLVAPPIDDTWLVAKNHFLSALLEGNHNKAITISKEKATTAESIASLYLQVIQPSMYEIGMLWERNEITVAQEHLASAIVSRVMASMSELIQPEKGEKKYKAVVTAAPNEYHEIGAWMVSDILEMNGWKVHYLGANTPLESLTSHVESFAPDLVAISVTMPFNLSMTKEVITAIKSISLDKKVKVLVGGHVFVQNHELWKVTGADGFGRDLDSTMEHLKQWNLYD